jgi:hypothetical protein
MELQGIDISTLQRPVLLLELSTLQRPVLHLDVSTQYTTEACVAHRRVYTTKPVLHLDVSTPQRPELHLDLSTLQRPVLLLKVFTLHAARKILFMYSFLGFARPQSQFSHSCVCERCI